MKIGCSAGHVYDLSTFKGRWDSEGRQVGDRCPMELHYDRIFGHRYCRRILKEVKE